MNQETESINAYEFSGNKNSTNSEINDNLFSHIDFGPLKQYLDDDNVTDISYSNNGQLWLKSLDKGVYRVNNPGINNELMEKIAFQCANIMGKVFNMASPFLDSESAELRMNFVHDSVARNGIAVVFRKTPAKIRLKKEKIIEEHYITNGIHDFLIDCVKGHCNIIVSGETGSGKTELVKYLASHTAENEKIITIEDTLELHLDRIYPNRDIVAMKTNNIASYSDVLVTCMRQNPKWILLSEVRSAEAVTAVRNSISSGHNILSTIHADKAQSIPHRLYSLLESNIDVDQFMTTIYRYVQLGVHVRARYKDGKFMREVCEVCEFHVTTENVPEYNIIYRKAVDGTETLNPPSKYLIDYLEAQGVFIKDKDYTKTRVENPFDSKKEENNNDKNVEEVLNEEKNSAVENKSEVLSAAPTNVKFNNTVKNEESIKEDPSIPNIEVPKVDAVPPIPAFSSSPVIDDIKSTSEIPVITNTVSSTSVGVSNINSIPSIDVPTISPIADNINPLETNNISMPDIPNLVSPIGEMSKPSVDIPIVSTNVVNNSNHLEMVDVKVPNIPDIVGPLVGNEEPVTPINDIPVVQFNGLTDFETSSIKEVSLEKTQVLEPINVGEQPESI